MKKSIFILLGLINLSYAYAYNHIPVLPKDFSLEKCIYDKELLQYQVIVADKLKYIPPTHQIVAFSHTSVVNKDWAHDLPDGPKFAYDYMCSYKNSEGKIKHIWTSYINVDSNGKRIKTYVMSPENDKNQPVYDGPTYKSWTDWYEDVFYNDHSIDKKYKDFDKLEYFAAESYPVYDKNNRIIEYKKYPLHKYRYVGTFVLGKEKYHAWESFRHSTFSSRVFVYTKEPYPPDFYDKKIFLDKSNKLF